MSIFHRKKRGKKESRLLAHLKSIGFSNRLAVYILFFLAGGLAGGFYLAKVSIDTGYTGSLLCWTVAFTPLGTAVSIALGKIVDKSKAENTEGGIKYAVAVQELSEAVQAENPTDGVDPVPDGSGDAAWESPQI